jgi:hypothetical protein
LGSILSDKFQNVSKRFFQYTEKSIISFTNEDLIIKCCLKGEIMEPNNLLNLWEELKALVESVEQDVVKSSRGVAAAGVRTRRGLRTLKAKATEVIKLTISNEKEKKASQPPAEPAKSTTAPTGKTKKL